MSKLASMLQWSQTNLVKPIQESLQPVIETKAEWIYHKPTGASEHRLSALLQVSVYLTEAEAAATRDTTTLISHIVDDARRQIVEAVFGEFRETINGIERAVWARDFETARLAVKTLREQMFSDR